MPEHQVKFSTAAPPENAPDAPDALDAQRLAALPLGQVLVRLGKIDMAEVLLAAYEQDLGDTRRLGEILVARGLASREDVEAALRVQHPDGDPPDVDSGPEPDRDPTVEAAPVGFPTVQSGRLRAVQAVTLFLLLVGAVGLLTRVSGGPAVGVSLYGLLSLPYLLFKLVMSCRYRPVAEPAPDALDVTVVVPFYNEDPKTFRRCLDSILAQSRPPAQVYVVDDGSPALACYEVARHVAARHANVAVHRFPENRGKREAQAWGFLQATTPVVATVDSDTVLHPDALAEGVKPLADGRVNAVCGYARALNPRRNVLTRLIDLRYTNAFLYERAAYSVLGSVLCSTGVLSLWRREVVTDNYDAYLGQTFLGVKVNYGDDRRLTAFALRTGRVVLQDTAVALTAVPETMPHFLRQQVRWNKSFFRESLLLLKELRPNRVAWWLGAAEFCYWVVLTTMLLYSVAVGPLVHHRVPSWQYGAFVALMAYARSVRMIGDGGRLLPRAFLLAPLYGVLNLLVLVPLRLYSLVRLRDGSWGTRTLAVGRRRHASGGDLAAPPSAGPAAPVAGPAPPAARFEPVVLPEPEPSTASVMAELVGAASLVAPTTGPAAAPGPAGHGPTGVAGPARACLDVLPRAGRR